MTAPAIDPTAAHDAPAPEATSPAPEGAVRGALIELFRRVFGLYFREIEVTGNLPAADAGGRVFVGNHTNALVDPILVLTTAPCAIAPIAKSTLWKIPGMKQLLDVAGAVPIVRRRDDPTKQAGSNDEVFDKIAAALRERRNILIFPEGTSHNEPRLIELKTGAARMLARAREKGARGLTFQAVALEFEERQTFRSRCLVIYGPVRSVDDLRLDGDALVAAITEQVREDLSELLVEGATWPERLLIARVAEMVTNDTGARTLERWNSIGRQVEAARRSLAGMDEAAIGEVAEAVERYYERLAEEGLADEQLRAGGDPAPGSTLRDAALLLSLPLAAVGAALYAPPYYLTRFLANRIANDPDELSTYKIAVGLLAHPLWAAGLTGAAFALTPPPISAGLAAVAITSPFAALAWHDAAPRVRRTLRFAARGERIAELRALRAEAMKRIQAARDKLGL
jgi:glycerol-3-phosphate O-acyltransferase/dihydroxyacetone phosphate acyltransferase